MTATPIAHAAANARASAVRRAAVQATLAPSIRNTQPWRLRLGRDALEIHADWSRQLRVIDPVGRQLIMSCGCALFNARVAFAAAGLGVDVQRFPEPRTPELIGRLVVSGAAPPDSSIAGLAPSITSRRTNRHPFFPDAVPTDVVAELIRAAETEGARLVNVARAEDLRAAEAWSHEARLEQIAALGYRAESQAWRNYDHQQLEIRSGQCLFVLGTESDEPKDWLRAGEALEHILLEVTRLGYAANPMTQVVQVGWTKAGLRADLGLRIAPVALVLVGRAPATPATRRRMLVDVLSPMNAR